MSEEDVYIVQHGRDYIVKQAPKQADKSEIKWELDSTLMMIQVRSGGLWLESVDPSKKLTKKINPRVLIAKTTNLEPRRYMKYMYQIVFIDRIDVCSNGLVLYCLGMDKIQEDLGVEPKPLLIPFLN